MDNSQQLQGGTQAPDPVYPGATDPSLDPQSTDLDNDSDLEVDDLDPDADELTQENLPGDDSPSEEWEASGSFDDEEEGEEDLDFDPESPDVSDPQVDPVGAAIVPGDIQDPDRKTAEDREYDPLADLKP